MSTLAAAPQSNEQENEQTSAAHYQVRLRETVAILLTVLLADLTLYRGHGYAGIAVLFVGTTTTFRFGKRPGSKHAATWIVATMLGLLAVRLLWLGSPLQVIIGFCLFVAFATALHGKQPTTYATLMMASQVFVAGCSALREYAFSLCRIGATWHRRGLAHVLLPALAFVLFGGLFVLANPDAVTFVGRRIERLLSVLSDWFVQMALRPSEPIFWIAAAWIAAGLLKPVLQVSLVSRPTDNGGPAKQTEAPLYFACRNTLFTVIGLFGLYLAYEYYALWKREFPEGFYYAGYAHEGAAWLTVALGLATLILSLIFSRTLVTDPRVSKLRMLAWIWSVENLLLALAVYNRLFIYIDFNGLTRMRVLGLFGISLVVGGFVLVVWKIARQRPFAWLLQRQLWALAAAIYLFALTPVDAVAVSYNVNRIQHGDLSACMQIGVHPLDLEGHLALTPLLNVQVSEIRQGVAALIATQYIELQAGCARRREDGWTAYQISDGYALEQFDALREHWQPFENEAKRAAAISRLYDFAYQWY